MNNLQKKIKILRKKSLSSVKKCNKQLGGKFKSINKIIKKNTKTLGGKMVAAVILIVTVAVPVNLCSKAYKYVERKKLENKISSVNEKINDLQTKINVNDTINKEIEKDVFAELVKTLNGFNIEPHIENIHARPKTITMNTLKKNNIEVSTSEHGTDHIQLEEKLKFNILDEIEKEFGRSAYRLFNPLDITQISGLSEDQFRNLLPANLKDIASKLYEVEHPENKKDIPINGLFIMAKTRLESADGTSRLSKEKNNLAGIGANDGPDKDENGVGDAIEAFYNTSPNDTDNPDWKKYGKYFKSKNECIDYLVSKLRQEYINPKGVWFNGDTKTKKVSIFDINKKYCSMVTWSYKILDLIEKAEESIGLDY